MGSNLYELSFNSESYGNDMCDHVGTGFEGVTAIIDDTSADIMWFSASNCTFLTFSILTY